MYVYTRIYCVSRAKKLIVDRSLRLPKFITPSAAPFMKVPRESHTRHHIVNDSLEDRFDSNISSKIASKTFPPRQGAMNDS